MIAAREFTSAAEMREFYRALDRRLNARPQPAVVIPIRQPETAPDAVAYGPALPDANEVEWSNRIAEAQDAVNAARGRLGVKYIIGAFAAERGITYADITGRARMFNHARQDCIAEVIRIRPDVSYVKLGEIFDNRDHSSIIHLFEQSKVRSVSA